MVSATFELACGVDGETGMIDLQRDCLCDEGCLASLRSAPACDRVVSRKVQADVGMTERRKMAHSGTNRVGELGHRQLDRGPSIMCGGRREIHPVRKQGVQLLADLSIGPLRIGLPARNRLEARR